MTPTLNALSQGLVGLRGFRLGLTRLRGINALLASDDVGPPAFAVAADDVSLSATYQYGTSGSTEASAVSVTGGLSGALTYLWEYVSGSNDIEMFDPQGSASMRFKSNAGEGVLRNAVWRCKVTNARGQVAYTQNIDIAISITLADLVVQITGTPSGPYPGSIALGYHDIVGGPGFTSSHTVFSLVWGGECTYSPSNTVTNPTKRALYATAGVPGQYAHSVEVTVTDVHGRVASSGNGFILVNWS
jgi:hypothetical protein